MTKPPKSRSSASSAARSTPGSPPRKGWSRSSTRSTPSARPARPTSPASGPRAGCWSATSTTTAASPAARWNGRPEAAAGRHRGRAGRRGGGLQDRPPQPLAGRFRQAGRGVRPQRRDLRLGDAVVQHHHVDGAADAEHPALLRPVRARGDGRAHPRQGRRVSPEGHVDGRGAALRLPGREPEAGGGRGGSRACPLDLRTLPRDRIGHRTGAGSGEARHPHTARQPDRQELHLPDAHRTAPTSARRSTRA